MVVSEPDLVVQQGEKENVVDEWFESSRCFGDTEYLSVSANCGGMADCIMEMCLFTKIRLDKGSVVLLYFGRSIRPESTSS